MTLGQKLLMKFLEVALCVCLIVFACDILPALAAWVRRIHIGRFADRNSWRAAVKKQAMKQVKRLPAIPVTDAAAYTIFPRLKGAYKNRAFLCWQEACLLLGLEDEPQAATAARAYFDKANVSEGPYTIGNAMLLYALMKNGFAEDEKVKLAAKKYVNEMLSLAGGGTLPYNPRGANRFVDTLGMVCPFLMLCDKLYNIPQATALAQRQLDEYYAFGIHERTGLPVHCFSSADKAPLGVYGWGRGCGWLAIALGECCCVLDKDDAYRPILLRRMDEFAQSVIKYQQPGGSFTSMFGTQSRADSSATAILGWFLFRASEETGKEEYAKASRRCEEYLMSVTRINGIVDFAQGDTIGVGNYSRRFAPMPTAQGFALKIGEPKQ